MLNEIINQSIIIVGAWVRQYGIRTVCSRLSPLLYSTSIQSTWILLIRSSTTLTLNLKSKTCSIPGQTLRLLLSLLLSTGFVDCHQFNFKHS